MTALEKQNSEEQPVTSAIHAEEDVQFTGWKASPLGQLFLNLPVLLRSKIAGLVFLLAALGGLLGLKEGTTFGLWRIAEASLYITLVTGSASILNQLIERKTDALMPRTQKRPLVTGSVKARHAFIAAILLGVLGAAGLVLSFNVLSAVWSIGTLIAYVAIYTPMKRVSTLNTAIGALPGAAPPLLGYVALAGDVGPWAWALFGIMFVWQFPHFMAIAWLYREDYASAGMRMVPAVPGSKGVAGVQALIYAVAIIPISLLPTLNGLAGMPYAIGAFLWGLAYLLCSMGFALKEDRFRARLLLYVSLAYPLLLFVSILTDPVVRAGIALGT